MKDILHGLLRSHRRQAVDRITQRIHRLAAVATVAEPSMLIRFWHALLARFGWQPSTGDGQSLGLQGEQLAARFLKKLGYRILARGHRQRLGELDLVALDGQTLVFVEVKTWRTGDKGDPSLAVDERKQEKLTRAALTYMKRRRLLEYAARFDVVSIVWDGAGGQPTIRHFINAFEAVGKWQMHR